LGVGICEAKWLLSTPPPKIDEIFVNESKCERRPLIGMRF